MRNCMTQISRTTALLATALLLSGCADMGYLLQSAQGHLAIVNAARPVDDWLADEATPPALKARLQLAQQMRRYAVGELHLPDNNSYTRYAALGRRAAVWNVTAAPEFSLTAKTWCFPVAGCVGYRGYFDESDAQALATTLRGEGWEATVYPVPAYSTLGRTNWLGGDPLLSTFIAYPEGELARMIFHELAHQVVYAPDDTPFNESFATAVERLGGAAWLSTHASPTAQQQYAALDARRQDFRALTAATRQRLVDLYASDRVDMHAAKAAIYAEFRAAYAERKTRWGGDTRYDAWVANANNAAFAAVAAYDDWVGALEQLFQRSGRDWPAFYRAARALAGLPKAERTLQLQALQSQPP